MRFLNSTLPYDNRKVAEEKQYRELENAHFAKTENLLADVKANSVS